MTSRLPALAPDLSDEELKELTALRELEIDPLVIGKERAAAVHLVRQRLAQEHRTAVRLALLVDLSMILLADGRHEEAIEASLERISLAPDDPLIACGLSGLYQCLPAYVDGDCNAQQRAIDAIDTAVAKARACGAWLRYCLNHRCRLSIELNRWDLLEESMRKIVEMPLVVGTPDIWPEGDFLKRVPEGVIDPELLSDYRKLLADWEARKSAAGFGSAAAYWCR